MVGVGWILTGGQEEEGGRGWVEFCTAALRGTVEGRKGREVGIGWTKSGRNGAGSFVLDSRSVLSRERLLEIGGGFTAMDCR